MGNPKKWGLHSTRTERDQHGIRKTGAERAKDRALCNDPDDEEVNYRLKKKGEKKWIVCDAEGNRLTYGKYPDKKSALDAARRLMSKSLIVPALEGRAVSRKGPLFIKNLKTGQLIEVEG